MKQTTIKQYCNVTVNVEDNRGTWKEDKPVQSVIATFNTSDNSLKMVIPEPVKRDTTKNPALYVGEKTKMQVTVRKDGNYGFSWTPKAGELRILGITKVVSEFRKAMEKYFEAIA